MVREPGAGAAGCVALQFTLVSYMYAYIYIYIYIYI